MAAGHTLGSEPGICSDGSGKDLMTKMVSSLVNIGTCKFSLAAAPPA